MMGKEFGLLTHVRYLTQLLKIRCVGEPLARCITNICHMIAYRYSEWNVCVLSNIMKFDNFLILETTASFAVSVTSRCNTNYSCHNVE